jgi:hypothetical protein
MGMAAGLRRAGRRSRHRPRRRTVGPALGRVRHARGFRQVLRRGLDEARGERAPLRAAHDLLKLDRAAGT